MVKLTKEQIEYRKKMNKLIKQGKVRNRDGQIETKLFEIPEENNKGCLTTIIIIIIFTAILAKTTPILNYIITKTVNITEKPVYQIKNEKENIIKNNTETNKKESTEYEKQENYVHFNIKGLENNKVEIDKGYEKFNGTLKFTQIQPIQYTDMYDLTYELIGTMEKGTMVSIEVICYDEQDYVIGNTVIIESGIEGKELKYKNSITIPKETKTIEILQKGN